MSSGTKWIDAYIPHDDQPGPITRLTSDMRGYNQYWTLRETLIGASEAFAACGGDGLMELYYRKIGEIQPGPPNLAMRRGNALESLMCELMEEELGNKITDTQVVYYNSNYPGLCARVDAEDDQGNLIELKTTGRREAYRHGLGDDAESIPARWNVQCQVQMMLAGVPQMFLGVLISDPDEFRVIEVQSVKVIQERTFSRIRQFLDCVKKKEPPWHLAIEQREVAHYYKPIEGETFEADSLLCSLLEERQRLTASKAEASRQLDEVNTEIRAILKGRTAIFGDGSTLSLVTRKNKGSTVEPYEYTQLKFTEARNNGNG